MTANSTLDALSLLTEGCLRLSIYSLVSAFTLFMLYSLRRTVLTVKLASLIGLWLMFIYQLHLALKDYLTNFDPQATIYQTLPEVGKLLVYLVALLISMLITIYLTHQPDPEIAN